MVFCCQRWVAPGCGIGVSGTVSRGSRHGVEFGFPVAVSHGSRHGVEFGIPVAVSRGSRHGVGGSGAKIGTA
jgi:hypothetical protein